MSNQYLNLAGMVGDTVVSRPIKPMHLIFTGKGLLYQKDSDVITSGPIINIYIVYKTTRQTISSNFVLKNCLFGAVKTTNTDDSDPDKWQYIGYGIEFDSTGSFTHPDDGKDARNVIVFGADMSNSRHRTNKTQSVLILGNGLIQKINDATIYAEKMYSPNFTVDNKTFCLSLHYSGDNSYVFDIGEEVTRFKAKNSELIKHSMCLGGL